MSRSSDLRRRPVRVRWTTVAGPPALRSGRTVDGVGQGPRSLVEVTRPVCHGPRDHRRGDHACLRTSRTVCYDAASLALDLRWWAAANYLTVGQIYLRDNALLREPLRAEHIKPRLLGHWGTSPGLST